MPVRPQLKLLTRHFFRQFFFLDLGDGDESVNASMPRLLGLAATPGFIFSMYEMSRYAWLELKPFAVEEQASLLSKFFLLTLTMTAVGLAALFQWESLFPERRDYVIFGSLPIRTRDIFASKAAALMLFVAVFAGAINALSSVIYPFIALRREEPVLYYFRLLGTHLICMTLAALFVFFTIAAVQGLLLNLMPKRLLSRASIAAQFLLMLCLASLFFLAFDAGPLLAKLKKENAAFLYFCPPVWFVGLYEQMLGHGDPVFAYLAQLALRITAAVTVLGSLTYLVSYRRQLNDLAEAVAESSSASPIHRALRWLSERTLVRTQQQRASFFFVLQTLARSRRHWLVLAAYVGAGAAFVLEGGFQYMMESRRVPEQVTLMLLSLPLVVSFFVLAGLRYVYSIPIQVRANWIFQIAQGSSTSELLSGVRRATALLALLPIYSICGVLLVLRLGWSTALLDLGFGVLVTLIMSELALLRFAKLPFTCSKLPGRYNVLLVGVIAWLAFSIYAYIMAQLELWLSLSWPRMLVFYALAAFALWRLRRYRSRESAMTNFVFEERPEPAIQQLGIGLG